MILNELIKSNKKFRKTDFFKPLSEFTYEPAK